MKRLLLAAAFFVAPAGVAHAAPPVQMVVRDVVAAVAACARVGDAALQPRRSALAGERRAVVPHPRLRRALERVGARRTTTRAGHGVWRLGNRRVDRRRRRDPGADARARVARARVPPLEPAGRRAGAAAANRRLAGDHLARGLAGGRDDQAKESEDRADAEARGRAPHRVGERLLVRAFGVDRSRHRGVPREGKRLGRHRLQLSRSTRAARSSRGVTAASNGTSSARTPAGSTAARSACR